MSTGQLRTCHSSVSQSIVFTPHRSECQTCVHYSSCQSATNQRRTVNRNATRRNTNGVRKTGTAAKNTNKKPGYVGGSVLSYDPTPEKDESVWSRIALNMLSAAASSSLGEASSALGRTKLGVRTTEHNRRARVKRNELDRELDALERKDKEIAAMNAKQQEKDEEIKQLRAQLSQFNVVNNANEGNTQRRPLRQGIGATNEE